MKQVNIPIFVPHLGCPHDCVFCNQKTITGVKSNLTENDINRIIMEHISTIDKKNTKIEIAFFGGSFTGISRKEQIKYLEIANKYLKDKKVDGIRISTRPDYINDEILDFLIEYGVTTIELGVQSLDEVVLKKSKRGHSIKDVIRASNLVKYRGLKLGLQMMIGLPGDTHNTTYKTAEKIISLKPDMVRIYPTIVFDNTELNNMYNNGQYTPIHIEDAIELSADILQLFLKNSIKVIRVGLQPTEDLLIGNEIIAGPFHPSFKQLVESRMYRMSIEEKLNSENTNNITIQVNNKDMTNLIGNNRDNIKYFNKHYPNVEISIIKNDLINRYSYVLINNDTAKKFTIY